MESKKKEILNRCFFGKRVEKLDKVAIIIEQIDNLLATLPHVELALEEIVIYYIGENELLVGREILGHNSDLKFHDDFELIDFPPMIAEQCELNISGYHELQQRIGASHKKLTRAILDDSGRFRVYFG